MTLTPNGNGLAPFARSHYYQEPRGSNRRRSHTRLFSDTGTRNWIGNTQRDGRLTRQGAIGAISPLAALMRGVCLPANPQCRPVRSGTAAVARSPRRWRAIGASNRLRSDPTMVKSRRRIAPRHAIKPKSGWTVFASSRLCMIQQTYGLFHIRVVVNRTRPSVAHTRDPGDSGRLDIDFRERGAWRPAQGF